jgi:hypothetical protein
MEIFKLQIVKTILIVFMMSRTLNNKTYLIGYPFHKYKSGDVHFIINNFQLLK